MSDRMKLAIAAGVVAVIAAWSIHGVGGASSTAAQEKLRAQVLERLVAVGEDDWARVFMAGQRVVLGGDAPNPEALAIATGAVRSAVWSGGPAVGGVTVVSAGAVDVVPPRTTPYQWRAELDDRVVRLSGAAVSREAGDELGRLAGALFSDRQLEDDLIVDRLAPGEGWPAAARGALVVLSHLDSGAATLSNFELSVTGEAADADAAQAARAALSRLGDTLSAASRINVRAPEAAPEGSPERSPEPSSAPLSEPLSAPPAAPVPSPTSDDAPAAAPLRGVPDEATGPDAVDEAAADETAPAPVDLALNESVATPSADVAADDAPRDEDGDAVAPSPDALAAEARARCQTAIDAAVSSGAILFTFNSAAVTAESTPVLEALAAALSDCPPVALSIEGHTDGVGATQANQTLSERRAQAVLDRLVALGVDGARLTAVGFGESRPVAENSSVAGRRENRRIEIIVSP